jgi:N utilization substance protein B
MSARAKARKRALDVLYESEARGVDPMAVLEERVALAEPPLNPYTTDLVRGVVEHRSRIDELITTYSDGWSVARMPAVDRNVLRVGAYELLWSTEVPESVAISEAVELAGDLSTEGSATFVNGLLARLLSVKPSLVL